MNVFNPELYSALVNRFGTVLISNEGQRMISHKIPDPYERGKYKEVILEPGENYRVNCPYCGDARHRLYVHYRWNTKLRTGEIYGRNLIHCFNEECNTYTFEDELQAYLRGTPVIDRSVEAELKHVSRFEPVDLPGFCIPLDQLPNDHPAVSYVRDRRKFDPGYVAKAWGVHYCQSCAEDEHGFVPGTKALVRLVLGRLIIPIYRSGMLVGWQARALGDHQIKYYTMPGLHVGQLIYNSDRSRNYDFGVIVEGVMDAWRVGLQSGALFGKKMSWRQRELAVAYWGNGALCLMLDSDATEDMDRIQQMINPDSFRWGSFCLELPGKDPADMDHETIWGLIASYARSRNIRITAG